jgi:phage terminase large subunit-like protein
MGMRGPGASRARAVAARAAVVDDLRGTLFADSMPLPVAKPHPWEAEGLTRAERVIAFVESLPCTKGLGVGEPIELDPFQREWIENVYRDGDDGERAVRTALLSVARGNGKSVLCAALCLCHLLGPESEPRGECYSAAATKEQSALIFREMEAVIMAVPWMAVRVNVQRFYKAIEDLPSGSIYRALASDGKAVHGLASSFVIADELAQWKSRELFDVLRTSLGKRRAPLLAIIGTQSPRAENIMSELVDYAARIEAGEIADATFHGRLYAIPDDADVFDPANWLLANPALGRFRSYEEMAQEAERARRMPTFEPSFRNLYCNQRVDAEAKAINPAEWAACGGAIDLSALKGRRCYGGLDLSNTRDLTALILWFPDDGGAVLPFIFCPKDNLAEREEHDRVPYRTWAKQGFIIPTPGAAIDKRFIVAKLGQVMTDFDVQSIAYDRWGIVELKAMMDAEGVKAPLEPFGQGYRDMGPAVDAFETAMLHGQLCHAMHPVLRWCAGNMIFTTDPAGARKADKNRSIDRIDPMVALIMATGIAARDTGAKTYQGGGVRWL